MEDFKYDVAFSFVQKDESIALQLYKLLNDRIRCFIYTEEQKLLAGTDGEKTFNSVFSKESRIVVILFRKEWGNTKWTRIEETAIRNKGFEEGYDFVLLVPTEKNFTSPKWLPKNRIWIGLERWGIESAASVIEARIQEFGGTIKVASISDKAARAEQNIKDKQKREHILNSPEGLTLAFNEVKEVIFEIKKHESGIKNKVSDWHIKVRGNTINGCDIFSYGYYLTFQFHQEFSNTPDKSFLLIALYKGYFDENGYATDLSTPNKQIALTRIRFDINEFNQYGWSSTETRMNFTLTGKLVEHWFDKLITCAAEERLEGNY
jgi:hypothetical protein